MKQNVLKGIFLILTMTSCHAMMENRCSWMNPYPTVENLASVWVGGPDAIFAVGDNGVLLRWDGVTWHLNHVPGVNFTAVWGEGPDDVYAVGNKYIYNGTSFYGFIFHWNGVAWDWSSIQAEYGFIDVWGCSRNSVYAATTDSIYHWNGSGWETFIDTAETITILAISGSGDDDIYVVGIVKTDRSCLILHWNGFDWQETSCGTGNYLNAIRSVNKELAFAVGDSGMLMMWDGQQWNVLVTGNDCDFIDVWADGIQNAYMVSKDNGIFHWDGTTLNSVDLPTDDAILSIGGTTGLIIAVGNRGSMCGSTGSDWNQLRQYLELGNLSAVWGTSKDDLFVVGDRGAFHWDGNTWNSMAIPPSGLLMNIWGTAGDDVFAVTDLGYILHYDGNSWSLMPRIVGCPLYSVWGFNSNDVYASGGIDLAQSHDGVLLHWDGTQWNPMAIDWSYPIYDVWGFNDDDLYATAEGALFHWDGDWWSYANGSARPYSAIWGIAEDRIVVVSGGAIYVRWGGDWHVYCCSNTNFFDVAGIAHDQIYVVGEQGCISMFNGIDWNDLGVHGDDWHGIWANNTGDMVVVGNNGSILHLDNPEPNPYLYFDRYTSDIYPGNSFIITLSLNNPTSSTMTHVPLVVMLEAFDDIYFWPSWTKFDAAHPTIPDLSYIDLPRGKTNLTIVPSMTWPDIPGKGVSGLKFMAAMLNQDMTDILCLPATLFWGYHTSEDDQESERFPEYRNTSRTAPGQGAY